MVIVKIHILKSTRLRELIVVRGDGRGMSSYRQGIQTAVKYGALPEIDENATTLVVERQVAESDRHMVLPLSCCPTMGPFSIKRAKSVQ
jgi:hypothetical protein